MGKKSLNCNKDMNGPFRSYQSAVGFVKLLLDM